MDKNQIVVELTLVKNPVQREDIQDVKNKISYDKDGVINKDNLHLFLSYERLSEIRKVLRNRFWTLKVTNK